MTLKYIWRSFSLVCHFHVHFSCPWQAFASHGLQAIAELLVIALFCVYCSVLENRVYWVETNAVKSSLTSLDVCYFMCSYYSIIGLSLQITTQRCIYCLISYIRMSVLSNCVTLILPLIIISITLSTTCSKCLPVHSSCSYCPPKKSQQCPGVMLPIGHVKLIISLTYSYGAPLGYKRTAHAAVAL